MMKTILTLTLVSTVFGFSTAQAQSFTYESKADTPTVVGGVGPAGQDYVGAYWTAKTTAKNSDGSTTKAKSICVSMSQPPNSQIFDSHAACEVTASNGTFSVVFGCTIVNAETGETSCVGGMAGKTGDYAGARGNLTSYNKSGTSTGTGQWHN